MRISFIIPSFNRAELLKDSLDSILENVTCEFEIVVCDDGSTDHTPQVCNEYVARGVRVIHSRSAERFGAQVARNRGLEIATGEAVMFMDSDDALAGPGIMDLVSALEADPHLGYAYGRVVKTDSSLGILEPVRSTGSAFEDVPRELAGYHWHTMGPLYRRSTLVGVGQWNIELTGSQDWEYQARVKLFGGRGLFVDVVVGYWRQHEGERVGTAAFRPDYVKSVMLACHSILVKARSAGRCDVALERRIAKRLVVHALEWGVNGCPAERRECLLQAMDGIKSDRWVYWQISMLMRLPSIGDRWIRRRLGL